MGNNEVLSKMFQEKLYGTEMDVRDGFWDDLQSDLSQSEGYKVVGNRAMIWPYRKLAAAAALIIVILGLASVTRWLLSPSELQDNMSNQRMWSDGSLISDRVVADKPLPDANFLPDISTLYVNTNKGVEFFSATRQTDVSGADYDNGSADEVVHVTIQITEQIYGPSNRGEIGYTQAANSQEFLDKETTEEKVTSPIKKYQESSKVWKLMTGTALPHGGDYVPIAIGATVECPISNKFSVESGLLFNHYFGDGEENINSLILPIKTNLTLASSSKAELYATVGVAAEKTLEYDFSDDPVRFSVMGGVGVNYKIKDRLALFAEPTVSHHFNNDGMVVDLHGNDAVQLGLTCGLRMSY